MTTPGTPSSPCILHCISAYPDPIGPETSASSRLLALTADAFVHRIYSFKRAGWRGDIRAIPFDDPAGQGHRAMVYGAPPKGLAFAATMRRLADWIIADATERGLRPDVVHAHKLTLDGLVGQRVAAHFGVPLAVTVQSNTDTRIIDARRDLRPDFTRIWTEAAEVFPFTPIAAALIEQRLGPRTGPVQILPCPPGSAEMIPPTLRPAHEPPLIVTAFHLEHWKNKNIRTLLLALREVPDLHLDLIGGGSPEAFLTLSEMAETLAPGRVRMLGSRAAAEVQARMNAATAFALVSHRESYGMVYAEALLAGTPCLHSSGRGFDRMFEDGAFTHGVDPSDVTAVKQALIRLIDTEAAQKARLREAQDTGALDPLCPAHIAQTYSGTLAAVIHGAAAAKEE